MKKYIFILLAFVGFSANAQINTLTPGTSAPDFKLKNVDGKEVSFANYPNAKGFIVVFTCNTCPVAKAYETRIMELDKKFAPLGYPVIAINPNDPEVSQGDNFDAMKELAKAKKYSFPYLYDAGQVITNKYGAKNTPHIFIVSKTATGNVIEYTGSIDNDQQNNNPERTLYVENAINALRSNSKPLVNSTKAIGCTVRRKAVK
ncbi:MAG: thioredoxin family protein [Chitinophagaceae bacterium]|nr:thioredoxin family protein [Chitinophagaceae bacterium]